MDKCVTCGKDLPPFTYREPHAEGFVCRKCADGGSEPKDSAGKEAPAKPVAPQPKPGKEDTKREVPGLSDAIDGLLKD
jgi:recombinational DNA repair protein (RecF pathway)